MQRPAALGAQAEGMLLDSWAGHSLKCSSNGGQWTLGRNLGRYPEQRNLHVQGPRAMASRKMTLGHCLFVDSLSTVRGQARPGHPVALSPRALALMNPPAVFPLASDIRACSPSGTELVGHDSGKLGGCDIART
ncbi:hypothetical protein CPAR01_02366 [Colletotrichum paranaense]|uniref:Uncharacterized protein n=1 Tax=Colletotrichum paranaense TaxID=1914294 RepID=A0ABQ9SZC4_9PEZI|nr:uncharacterized protein CPAR01_02366 [Colletotrichum paranaense]KAK1544864.1 hypothetical protein CPAR01_02366 [Colletotrichum paranaense]